MTFDKFEGRKKMNIDEWNLNRFCNKIDYVVIGAASKLLKYFKENYVPSRIVSYADRDWSEGNLYYKIGFGLISAGKPDYKYIIDQKRIHKSRFRKSRLKYQKSESSYMFENNIPRVYDCGKLKFSWLNSQSVTLVSQKSQ
jgi:hypothetical protein